MKEILKSLADVVFPPRCMACGSVFDEPEDRPFCPACESRIRYITSPLCPRCGIPLSGEEGTDHFCGECLRDPPPFSAARAVARLAENPGEARAMGEAGARLIAAEHTGDARAAETARVIEQVLGRK